MTTFSIEWDRFTVLKKHDIDKDLPYLWMFGIVVDAKSVDSGKYVMRKPAGSGNLGGQKFKKGDDSAVPSDLDFSREIQPLAGKATAGVVVVAWENAMTKDSVIIDAYRNAADLIDEMVDDIVKEKLQDVLDALKDGESLDEIDLTVTDAEMNALRNAVEAEVTRTIKAGWTLGQAIHDHEIATNQTVLSLCESLELALDYRFISGSTDYHLEGTMSYADPKPPGGGGRPPEDGSIQVKNQSPKPQSTVRN
jgi:hypothetical protein